MLPQLETPKEVYTHIFSYLTEEELVPCFSVCKLLERLVWEFLSLKFISKTHPSKKIAAKVTKVALCSHEKLIEQITHFAEGILGNQEGYFVCFFPWNPSYKVIAQLGCSSPSSTRLDICVFTASLPDKVRPVMAMQTNFKEMHKSCSIIFSEDPGIALYHRTCEILDKHFDRLRS